SFSGLKTALLKHLREHGITPKAGRPRLAKGNSDPDPSPRVADTQWIADTAASFQQAAVDMLVRVAINAAESTGINDITLTGGVACNTRLRESMADAGRARNINIHLAPKVLCTDNAAMIA